VNGATAHSEGARLLEVLVETDDVPAVRVSRSERGEVDEEGIGPRRPVT
jgi:hypothetical protein